MEPLPNQDPTDPAPSGAPEPGPPLPPPTAAESLVNALLDSGPEVAEHVVRATQELLLAAQAIVDAAERAIDEQKELRTPPAEPAATRDNVHSIDRDE